MPTLLVDQVVNAGDLGLTSGLADLFVLDTGSGPTLYALSRAESALVELSLAADGTISIGSSLGLQGTFETGSTPEIGAMFDASGSVFLTLAGMPSVDGQLVSLATDGSLQGQVQFSGTSSALDAPVWSGLGPVQALVTGRSGGGLELFTDVGTGFSSTAVLNDAADAHLADVSGSIDFAIGGQTYLVTTSASEHGVNLVELTPTTLIQTHAIGAADGLPISTPTTVEIVQSASLPETLVVVGSVNTSSLSVLRVTASRQFEIADHIMDSAATRVQAPSAIATAGHGDFTFVAAGGADGGVSLFTVLPGGRLVHLSTILDDAATTLYRVSAIEMSISGNRLNLFVSSAWEGGVTRLGYDLSALGSVLIADVSGGSVIGTVADDQLVGSDLDDTLIGGAGDDIVFDGTGQDVLSGGAGQDLFVLHADGQQDTITDYNPLEDKLDLSAWDFLYDVSQLTITSTGDGAILSYGDENLVIHAENGAPLTASDFSNDSILNVDRPPNVPVEQSLTGGLGNDTLNGAAGADVILGMDGSDILTGRGGDDTIRGGLGDDILDGGAGDDNLSGETGSDTIVGGTGADFLDGGTGGDLIYGDSFDWSGG